ncbi:hypothetical protein [Rhodococcus erythropolis]|nr:hypothetical protein [Rhodococcus erythropolis]
MNSIARHKTAMARTALSRPMSFALGTRSWFQGGVSLTMDVVAVVISEA